MSEAPKTVPVVCFGTFEVDLQAGELHKNGRKVRIQDLPFRLLAVLLERPGEIVTREQLRERLWQSDTFVEFEHSLNAAVAKLRTALGDSAESPRFIETVPRRGYRFLAPVDVTEAAPAPPPKPRRSFSRHWKLVVAALALVLANSAFIWWYTRSRSSAWDRAPQFRLTQLTTDSGLTIHPALSRDGGLIAYSSDRAGEGNLDIWVQQVPGRSALRLTHHEAADHSPEFSPDGTVIAFFSARDGGGIYLVPSLGGDERLVAQGGHRPRFSPDGSRIAYVVGPKSSPQESELYVVPVSGGTPRRIGADFYFPANPIWTPDGKHVLFVGSLLSDSRTSGEAWIRDFWVLPVDGGGPVRVHIGRAFKELRLGIGSIDAWSSDGDYLVLSAVTGDSCNLWKVPISRRTFKVTGPPERLTFGTGEDSASLASNGRTAFVSGSYAMQIWGLSVDPARGVASGEPERLTSSGASDFSSDVSPDGKRLAFRSNRSGEIDVWTKDLATGKQQNVSARPGVEFAPKLSPDGAKVAYMVPEGMKRAIFQAPFNGGPAERICEDCGGPYCWSADGSKIIYNRSHRDAENVGATIDVLDVRSGEHHVLLHHSQLPLYVARLSFDGRWITFKGDLTDPRALRSRIFVTEFRGDGAPPEQEWITITDGRFGDDLPRWAPNGDLLYFLSDRDGYRCIWARRLDPLTKQPLGEPFSIWHFHETRRSLAALRLFEFELAVARDKLVFPVRELRGNIWLMEPQMPK